MQPLSMFGPLDAVLEPMVEYVILALVLVNMGTRAWAYRDYRKQAKSSDSLSRNVVHEASNVLLILGAFYYLTLHHHAGIVFSSLVLGLFLTDFFEFEATAVEARNDRKLTRPNGALVASTVVFLYAAYQSVFFVVAPVWNSIV